MAVFLGGKSVGRISRDFSHVIRKFSQLKRTGSLKSATNLTSSFNSVIGKRYESSYKAAVLIENGKPLVIEEKKRKKLKKGDLRIKVHYAGVNMSDVLLCNSVYAEVQPKLPFVPGYEVSGQVLELSPEATKEGFAVGDKIVALNKTDFAGFAQECVVNMKDCWLLPGTLTYKMAASLADAYSTALIGLSRRGQIKEGDKVLVACAAGGLGLAAVDIAANVYRAKVIGVCDTEDKAEIIRNKGAWAALGYDAKHVLKKVQEVTDGKGVKIAFDAVGGPACEQLIKCVASEGSLIVAGSAIRRTEAIPMTALLVNAVSLMAVSLRSYRTTNPRVYRQAVQDAVDMCEQRLISPLIAKEFKLDAINDAIKYIEDKSSTGKVVISVEE